MALPDFKRIARRAAVAVAAAGLIAAPAFAFVAMGGGHGFHGGGFRAIVRVPAPPATVTARAPFVSAPPPMRVARDGFVFRFDDRFHRRDRFGDRRPTIGPRGEGFWGGGYGVYPTGYAEPPDVAESAPEPVAAAEAAPCPELLTWSPKLGRATRRDLCGNADVHLRSGALAGG